jgi:formylglycine-generating enzyme required for sulfatase activity
MSKAKNWAIVVGINQYQNIGHLKYANRDAEAMAAFFRSAQFDRVFCFADDLTITPEQGQKSTLPRSSDLVDFLHDRFTTKIPPLKAGDNCWFFFAGHGKRVNNRDCLLPQDYNSRLGEAKSRAIPVEDVREALLKSGADNVILLLDACRTEGDRDSGLGIGGDEQPGAITIFSCERNKIAYEIDELRHGAFTAALLEGLNMPMSSENCATVQRLNRHLKTRVPQLSKLHPEQPTQNPNTEVAPGEKWYLLLLPKVATEQDILALENQAQRAEIANDLDLAELLWRRCVAATGGEDENSLDGFARVREKRKNRRSTPANPPPPTPAASRSVTPLPKTPTFSFDIITVDNTGRETDRRPGTANYFREDLGNGITLDMVQIPGGRFRMGAAKGEEGASDGEFPQHEVTVEGFSIGKFAVTQAQWKAIANLPKVKTDLKPDPSNFKGANRPIEQVSWHEAIECCDRLSRKTQKTYRLPSEAQWEYACRAGTTTPFHFGETITTELANFDGTDWKHEGKTYSGSYAKAPKGKYRKTTIDVGSFPPNAFGLYDMHGNVWEWCMDTWHDTYDRAPNDGSAWIDKNAESRLVRGGSWYHYPHHCRSAFRYPDDPASRNDDLGFRVMCLRS